MTKKNPVRAVIDASFSLEGGQSLGIVGESGSGKTTLAKILAGFMEPDSGQATLDGKNVFSLPRAERAFLTQMVFQDPFSSINPKLLLRTQLEEGLRFRNPKGALGKQADDLMNDVGLDPSYLNRYPHQLSGGQRQRFAIARALSVEPQIMLADEPVSSLDLSVQAQIINLLNRLREKKNLTLLVISHDLGVIARLCQDVIVMKDGQTVEKGPTETLLTQPAHDYTRRLLAAAPKL